jgi:hypothetical protein
MGNGYSLPERDPLGQVAKALRDGSRRLGEVETQRGTQLYDTIAELRSVVDNLAATIAALSSSGATWYGPVSSGSGSITTTSGYIYTPAGYALDITYTRRAAWLGNDGRLGWASSSREHKTKIRNAKVDPLAILEIAPRLFNYRAEVEKHRDDPEYKVATEFGAIAEELHDLGLWQVVVYEEGKPVGLHYDLLGLLGIEAAKYVWSQHQALEARVAALESR